MPKRMTRRQVASWLYPIRSTLKQILTGEVDCIRGYAVTRLHHTDEYERIDYCIAGFTVLIARLFPGVDLSPLDKVRRMLASGTPMDELDIHRALKVLKAIETPLCKMPYAVVKDAVTTELIQIEVESLGLAA